MNLAREDLTVVEELEGATHVVPHERDGATTVHTSHPIGKLGLADRPNFADGLAEVHEARPHGSFGVVLLADPLPLFGFLAELSPTS